MLLEEVQIELAGVCNATCVYCTWQKRTVGKKLMERGMAMRLLQEAKSMGVVQVRYHGLGESTVHPDLIEIVGLGESLGFRHSLSTNCFILKGGTADGLRAFHNLQLILAVPWVMHDKFVDICVKNALDYLSKPFNNESVHVQMVCHEDARKHYRRFVDTFLPAVEQSPKAQLHLKQPVTWPNDSPNRGFIDPELANHPQVIFDSRQTPLSIGKGCEMPNRFLMVLADGTAVPCCVGMDDWGLGNVQEHGLAGVWNSPRMAELRDKWHRADDSIPCGNCKKRTDCITQ